MRKHSSDVSTKCLIARITSRFILFVLIIGATSLSLWAQESTVQNKQPPWYETITVNGFLSSSYSYNFNKPDGMKNQFRVFDYDDNSIKMDVVELSVKKDVTNPGEAGFRFDLTAGSSIPKVTRSIGLNSGDLDFHQIFVSYIVPVQRGIRVDVGKFVTHMGYEVIEGYDGYNDNESRSFLFGYAIPFTHTGIRANYKISDPVSLTFILTNGWDNSVDNNRTKTVCAQLGITPMNGMNLFLNGIYGPECDKNDSDERTGIDFVGTYTVNDHITVGVNGDYGGEQNITSSGGNAIWSGVAGYLRLNLVENFSLCLRGEQFHDMDGVRTGVSQTLSEFTLTPEFRPEPHFVLRSDLRVDMSDKDVFQKENELSDHQVTVSMNVLYWF